MGDDKLEGNSDQGLDAPYLILTRFQPGDGGAQIGVLNRFNGFGGHINR
jgi:hypothetical protein